MSSELEKLVVEFCRAGLISPSEASVMLSPTVLDHAGRETPNPGLDYLDWDFL